jgi:hypothetical protein
LRIGVGFAAGKPNVFLRITLLFGKLKALGKVREGAFPTNSIQDLHPIQKKRVALAAYTPLAESGLFSGEVTSAIRHHFPFRFHLIEPLICLEYSAPFLW